MGPGLSQGPGMLGPVRATWRAGGSSVGARDSRAALEQGQAAGVEHGAWVETQKGQEGLRGTAESWVQCLSSSTLSGMLQREARAGHTGAASSGPDRVWAQEP